MPLKENKKCKTCRFYNVGCHPITKEKHCNDEMPDCYKPVKMEEVEMKESKIVTLKEIDEGYTQQDVDLILNKED